jgi:hypothetical protein
MKRVGLVTLLAALALAGCGGDDDSGDAPAVNLPPPRGSDTEQIQETWRLYYTSLAARDGGRACALLTERGRDEVVRESSDSGGECEEVVAVLGTFFKGYSSKLRDIEVSGESATAIAPRSGEIQEQALALKRDDGRWKIDHAERPGS